MNPGEEPQAVEPVPSAIVGENFAGSNLGGMNLGGMNLGGMNLGGMNLGGPNLGGMNLSGANLSGTNLAGMNLAGMNLSGTNLGGNNLGGMNMGATNLAGMNLGGMNLGGMNLAGMNMGASNLSGSNLSGTNLAGMNLAGMNLAGMNLAGMNLSGTLLGGTNLAGMNLGATNLAGMNLAGMNTGYNLHNLAGPINGMLYSGEDLWMPKTGQCIVLGLGSTAFPKLLAQQTANARMSVALGRLPWGFPTTAGGPIVLDAWEATVWGDKSYCTFILVAQPGSNWAGVAGFIKSVFRWNAPPSQSIDISGIEASAPFDPSLSTAIVTHTGMMGAAAKLNNGIVAAVDFMAGELAFITATTNNQPVQVDFSSWVKDVNNDGQILGNVDSVNPPQYAEGVFQVYKNPDDSVGVSISQISQVSGIISATVDLGYSYGAFQEGFAPKPIPARCSAALYLNSSFGEPMPPGKCDSGLAWTESQSGYPVGMKKWSNMAGTTAPMNDSMYLPAGGSYQLPYYRAASRPILSETYIFLWEPNHSIPASTIGGATGSDRTSLGVASSNVSSCATSEDASVAFNGYKGTKWCATGTPSTSSPRSIMYTWGAAIPITSYRITAASDYPTRDPKNWTFQACTLGNACSVGSDTGWVTLDTRTNQAFAARAQMNVYAFSNTTAYSQYRLRITANNGASDKVQVREIQMFDSGGGILPLPGVDRTENGTVTWTGKHCSTSELPTRAFDNLMTSTAPTHWCVLGVPSVSRPVSVVYGSASAKSVSSYKLTSSGDASERDPRNWTLQGCNGSCRVGGDAGWTTLDTRTSETFSSRYLTKTYTLSGAVSYAQYRLKVTANNGSGTYFQLGELQLF